VLMLFGIGVSLIGDGITRGDLVQATP